MSEYSKWEFQGEDLQITVTKGMIEVVWANMLIEDFFGDTARILPCEYNVDRTRQLKLYAESAVREFKARGWNYKRKREDGIIRWLCKMVWSWSIQHGLIR